VEPDELLIAEAEFVAALEYFKACIEDVKELGQ
jgi:hypothetical protein